MRVGRRRAVVLRTAMLDGTTRSMSYPDDNRIVTRPRPRRTRGGRHDILAYPRAGWMDTHESTGIYHSRRAWATVVSRPLGHPGWCYPADDGRERTFRYMPRIPWRLNAAFWDIHDMVFELCEPLVDDAV